MLSLKKIFKRLLFEQSNPGKGWLNFRTGKYLALKNWLSDLHFDFVKDNPGLFSLGADEKLDSSIFDVVEEKGWIAISYMKGYFSFRVRDENSKHVQAVQEFVGEKQLKPSLFFIDVVDMKRSYQIPYDDFMQADKYSDLRVFLINK